MKRPLCVNQLTPETKKEARHENRRETERSENQKAPPGPCYIWGKKVRKRQAAFKEGGPRRNYEVRVPVPPYQPLPGPKPTQKHKCVIPSKRSLLPWFRGLESCITAAAVQSPFQSQTTAAALGQLKMQGSHFYSGIVLCACRLSAECGLSSGLGRLHPSFLGWTNEMPGFVVAVPVATHEGNVVITSWTRKENQCFFPR